MSLLILPHKKELLPCTFPAVVTVMADFHPGSLLPEAAAYIPSPWWLALFKTCELAPGNRAAVFKLLSRHLHLHLNTEGVPVPPCGVAQWHRLGAETGVSMAVVRHLIFHSFTEMLGYKATSWPLKCHTYGRATRCDPQRHSWAGVCLKSSCLGDGFSSMPLSVFSSKVNGISGIGITKYIFSALILKFKLSQSITFSFKIHFFPEFDFCWWCFG